MQVLGHLAAGLAGDEGDRPRSLARVLHQHRLAKGVAAGGEQRVRDLLDRVVDRLDDRNAAQHSAALAQPPLAERCWPRRRRSAAAPPARPPAQPRHVAQDFDGAHAPPLGQQCLASRSDSQPNTPSSMPSTPVSTQTVTASGSQTSRPVTRYFFTRAASARCHCAARRRAAGGSSPWRVPPACGLGLGRRRGRGRGSQPVWRLAPRRRPACAASGLAAAGLAAGGSPEVGHVPARALELEAGRGDLLAEARRRRKPGSRRAAGRRSSAARPWRGRRSAAISVDRHVLSLESKTRGKL